MLLIDPDASLAWGAPDPSDQIGHLRRRLNVEGDILTISVQKEEKKVEEKSNNGVKCVSLLLEPRCPALCMSLTCYRCGFAGDALGMYTWLLFALAVCLPDHAELALS